MSQTHEAVEHQSTYRTPRWVKVFGIIALALVLLIGVMLISGGEYGPGRRMPPTEISTQQP